MAIDPGTALALQALADRGGAPGRLALVSVLADGYVFSPSLDGSLPWRPLHWTSAWRRLRVKGGIDPRVRLHDLRHFAATFLLDAGVPVKTVSSRLGHARPRPR